MATTPYPFVANTVLTASQLNSTYNVPVGAKTASYTLVAADGGTRVQMNSASATNITVNTGLFSAGDSVWLQNIGAGVMTVLAGSATVTTAGSLAVSQYGGGELYFTSASAAIFFPSGGKSVTKYIERFTASGTFTPATGVVYAIAYIQAGGGGVGASSGAGGTSSVAFAAGTISATGGANSNYANATGADDKTAGAANSGNAAQGVAAGGAGFMGVAQNGALITGGGVVTPATGITVTVGAGGIAGTSGAAGGSGYVFIEYYA